MRRDIERGALAGVIGTVAMTVLAMKPGLGGLLPKEARPELWNPRKVIRWGERQLGVEDEVDDATELVITSVAHVGYGATFGTLYAVARRELARVVARPTKVDVGCFGALYGLLLWVIGYEGWMPAAGIQPATTDKPLPKWLVPIGSHLVYGVTTAIVYEWLNERARPAKRQDKQRAMAANVRTSKPE